MSQPLRATFQASSQGGDRPSAGTGCGEEGGLVCLLSREWTIGRETHRSPGEQVTWGPLSSKHPAGGAWTVERGTEAARQSSGGGRGPQTHPPPRSSFPTCEGMGLEVCPRLRAAPPQRPEVPYRSPASSGGVARGHRGRGPGRGRAGPLGGAAEPPDRRAVDCLQGNGPALSTPGASESPLRAQIRGPSAGAASTAPAPGRPQIWVASLFLSRAPRTASEHRRV